MPKISKEKTNKKRYFTKDTENAILEYNETSNSIKKNIIYEKKIHYAFFKLTQNIIHTFKFYNTDVKDLEHLQHEIIVFLLDKIHLYNHSKNINKKINKIILKDFEELKYKKDKFINFTGGKAKVELHELHEFIESLNISEKCRKELYKINIPKAYSYFGTIVKRYLITYNQKNYDKKINKQDISTLVYDDSPYLEDPNDNEDDLYNFINLFNQYLKNNVNNLYKKEKDIKVVLSLCDLFDSIYKLNNNFKKKNVYMFLREISNLKTHQVTKTIKEIKVLFYNKWEYYLKVGEFN